MSNPFHHNSTAKAGTGIPGIKDRFLNFNGQHPIPSATVQLPKQDIYALVCFYSHLRLQDTGSSGLRSLEK